MTSTLRIIPPSRVSTGNFLLIKPNCPTRFTEEASGINNTAKKRVIVTALRLRRIAKKILDSLKNFLKKRSIFKCILAIFFRLDAFKTYLNK
jgi:hypothetical protein